jgi:hypothetical protein
VIRLLLIKLLHLMCLVELHVNLLLLSYYLNINLENLDPFQKLQDHLQYVLITNSNQDPSLINYHHPNQVFSIHLNFYQIHLI